ncbi:hypothetical protein BDV98DRAFT_273673 [Pterulicium gracile]|uniref:Transmembrane protein n=1 Tax=Pterulicium gracile TaxID=1884261 RepID=A0A5C3QA21_9AGAR|nr:hypothetical protein BDV98DRAFT_273673 [Pterula gracilis]
MCTAFSSMCTAFSLSKCHTLLCSNHISAFFLMTLPIHAVDHHFSRSLIPFFFSFSCRRRRRRRLCVGSSLMSSLCRSFPLRGSRSPLGVLVSLSVLGFFSISLCFPSSRLFLQVSRARGCFLSCKSIGILLYDRSAGGKCMFKVTLGVEGFCGTCTCRVPI